MSKHHQHISQKLGDFTATARVVPISLLAIGIGIVSTFVAWALLPLIAFFTNAFYYGRISTVLVSPAGNQDGILRIAIETDFRCLTRAAEEPDPNPHPAE